MSVWARGVNREIKQVELNGLLADKMKKSYNEDRTTFFFLPCEGGLGVNRQGRDTRKESKAEEQDRRGIRQNTAGAEQRQGQKKTDN